MEKVFLDNIKITVNGKTRDFGTDFNSAMRFASQNIYDKLHKFDKKTKQGYVVRHIFRNRMSGRRYAVIERSNDFVVGCGYDTATGVWAQGVYGFSNIGSAVSYAKKEAYGW